FIVHGGDDDDLQDDDGRYRMQHRQRRPPSPERELDVEQVERHLRERFGVLNNDYDEDFDNEETTQLDQQALIPCITDSKLWMVGCKTGHEREVVAYLMQKAIDKGSESQITSAIALDHLKNYIYVEAHKEAHVKEAIKGVRNIYQTKLMLVPLKEMTDVLSVESKAVDVSKNMWVRLKIGIYKGDLAKVVDVDNVRRSVTVKLIPRIDLQTLANKVVGGREVVKKKVIPPQRFINIHNARDLHLRVKRSRDRTTGDYFDHVEGMRFQDGFLLKTFAMKSISTQNIQPTLDELEKFRNPEDADDDSAMFGNREKGHFMEGDAVLVHIGDLKNLMGRVEKVEEEYVHIRPKSKDMPRSIVVSKKEVCKYFKPGDHVKVLFGARKGATGMVIKVEGQFLIIVSDSTKEDIRVFADHVTESTEVTSDVKFVMHAPQRPQSPKRPPRGGFSTNFGGRHRDGRGPGSMVGSTVKIRQGHYKGCQGRIVDINHQTARVELESQMKVVTVNRNDISDKGTVSTPFRETPHSHLGSETPMRPSRTPLHPYMPTPLREPGESTPVHYGMRTPMHDRAWNPSPLSPTIGV
ncbi:Transcription elongation factor spt5, partial [Thalictrum thalictroides]